jgi:hypothetical protein
MTEFIMGDTRQLRICLALLWAWTIALVAFYAAITVSSYVALFLIFIIPYWTWLLLDFCNSFKRCRVFYLISCVGHTGAVLLSLVIYVAAVLAFAVLSINKTGVCERQYPCSDMISVGAVYQISFMILSGLTALLNGRLYRGVKRKYQLEYQGIYVHSDPYSFNFRKSSSSQDYPDSY